MTTPGWYYAEGDPPGTTRYWDGTYWTGEPVFEPQPAGQGGYPAPPMGQGAPAAGHRGLPADAGTRMWGRVIDVLIQFALLVALVLLDIGGSPDSRLVSNSDFSLTLNNRSYDTTLEFVLFGLFSFAWAVGWIHLKGGTPGKLILGMRISDEATGQIPPTLQQSALRAANFLLPLLALLSFELGDIAQLVGFLIAVVSLVLLFSDSKRRTVMDRIAKTVVIKQ